MMSVATSAEDYIAQQHGPVQDRLRELRTIIRDAVPDAAEVIRYGLPSYTRDGRMVSIGAARTHCALYGTPQDLFADELRGYKQLKGTIQFALNQPVPEALVRKLVLAKLAPERTRQQ